MLWVRALLHNYGEVVDPVAAKLLPDKVSRVVRTVTGANTALFSRSHSHTRTHAHMHTHIYTHTHTHTHTHT